MSATRSTWLRDLVALTKPGVTRMTALTTAGGAWLAPGFDWLPALMAVLGASMAVASASAFNMWWERSSDPLMARTRNRPLAAKRMDPRHAFTFAALLGVLSLVVLAVFTNPLTTGLAALSIFLYVCVYTPLKYKTPLALAIGAIPGAAPPLLGWTGITGNLDAGNGALVADLLFRANAERQMTLVLVTHDATLAARCGRAVRLGSGRILDEMPAESRIAAQ